MIKELDMSEKSQHRLGENDVKFYRVGEFKENVLDGTVNINPKEQAPQFVLTRLNFLLGFLSEHSPDDIDAFTKKLEKDCLELFGWEAGMTLEKGPPLVTYRPDDPDDFIK